MQDECNVNLIMAKWAKTDQAPERKGGAFTYGDFSNANDYLSAHDQVAEAERAFMTLPSAVRQANHNDPAEFISWATDPANLDELRSLDLAPPDQTPAPPPAATTADPPAAPPAEGTGEGGE